MKPQEKWKKIEEARKILKLPVRTTRREIINNYRRLVKELHPDRGGNEELIKKINESYEILMEYCDNYLILLTPNDNVNDPEEWWFQHFGEDPIWGRRG